MITAIILSIIIPLLLLTLMPSIVRSRGGRYRRYAYWLLIASILYIVSWWLPSPLIQGRDTSFTTHFVGGGLFTGCVWYYFKQSLSWRAHWLFEAFSLFSLVSVLGVLNELFELILYLFGGMPNGISDTSWDLLANTLGAACFYILYILFLRSGRRINDK